MSVAEASLSDELGHKPIIEIIGLPGSGKTKVATVLERRAQPGVMLIRGDAIEPKRSGPSFVSLLPTPLFSGTLLLMVVFRRGKRKENFRKLLAVHERWQQLSKTRVPGTTAIVDEGPVHTLFGALFGTVATPVSNYFLKLVIRRLMKVENRFLFVDLPKSECIANFKNRTSPVSRFNHGTNDVLLKRFVADASYDDILLAISAINPGALVRCSSAQRAVDYLLST